MQYLNQDSAVYRPPLSMPRRSLFAVVLFSSLNCFPENAPANASAPGSPAQSDTARFSVLPREDKLYYYPCSDCHEYMDPNTEIRVLDTDADHPQELKHATGIIWCLSCHGVSPYNELHTLLGEPVGFNESHLICGGCHAHKLRDWSHGAHGKRVADWQGNRLLYGCAECHNPHHPQIAPRPALAPPPVRSGLDRVEGETERPAPVWDILREDRDDD